MLRMMLQICKQHVLHQQLAVHLLTHTTTTPKRSLILVPASILWSMKQLAPMQPHRILVQLTVPIRVRHLKVVAWRKPPSTMPHPLVSMMEHSAALECAPFTIHARVAYFQKLRTMILNLPWMTARACSLQYHLPKEHTCDGDESRLANIPHTRFFIYLLRNRTRRKILSPSKAAQIQPP